MSLTLMNHDTSSCASCSDLDSDTNNVDFELPSPELIARIVQQVEWIFSDENLLRDEFMNKLLRKNHGCINLKLVTSLRKIKVITKDWRVVRHAIRVGSSQLVLNDQDNKIRRLETLPPMDKCNKHQRTVLILNLPNEKKSVEAIHKDFIGFGSIALVRVIKSNSEHPSHTRLFNAIQPYRKMMGTHIATIEFNHLEHAEFCLSSRGQKHLLQIDSIWGEVRVCSIKKLADDEENKENIRPSSLLFSQHMTSNTKDIDLIVTDVTTKKTLVRILRAPKAPNGTIGFGR